MFGSKQRFSFWHISLSLGTILSQMVAGRLETSLLSPGVNSFTCLASRTENFQPKCFLVQAKIALEVINIFV